MRKDRRTGLRVLVVDDEPLIRYAISRFLSEEGLLSKGVVTAEEALDEIRAQYYDFCFLDINLPGMTGLEAMEKINEISPATKVVIMTANFLSETTIEQIKDVSYAFLEKPFNLSQISNLVDRRFDVPPEQQIICK